MTVTTTTWTVAVGAGRYHLEDEELDVLNTKKMIGF
jgi:hypothetical protein